MDAHIVAPAAISDDSKTTGSCCGTTSDNLAVCNLPQSGEASACQCATNTSAIDRIVSTKAIETLRASNQNDAPKSRARTVRGVVMLAIGCIASPCCTPLIVPVVLALLGTTTATVWLSQHIGWVYGSLTVLSIVSLFLGARSISTTISSKKAPLKQPSSNIEKMQEETVNG